jgi:hypothetical protein
MDTGLIILAELESTIVKCEKRDNSARSSGFSEERHSDDKQFVSIQYKVHT